MWARVDLDGDGTKERLNGVSITSGGLDPRFGSSSEHYLAGNSASNPSGGNLTWRGKVRAYDTEKSNSPVTGDVRVTVSLGSTDTVSVYFTSFTGEDNTNTYDNASISGITLENGNFGCTDLSCEGTGITNDRVTSVAGDFFGANHQAVAGNFDLENGVDGVFLGGR